MGGDKEAFARKKEEERNQSQTKAVVAGANTITMVAQTATPNNKQTAEAKNSGKTCPNFCRNKGFHILPVRYTVSTVAPALLDTLGKNVKEIPLSNFKYTVEMVNTGYIYSLVKRAKGPQIWSGYIVNDKGYLSYFNPVKDAAPSVAPDFGCNVGEHIIKASLVTVEEIPNNPALHTYLLYTHAPLSKAKLEEYMKNAEAYVSQGKWQKFEVSKWRNGTISQTHSFSIKQVDVINNKKSYGTRLLDTQKRFADFNLSIACMALYDPIKITTKINEIRNSQFKELMSFLAEKDNNNITNEHRLNSSNSIDSLKLILEKGLINQALNSDVMKDEKLVKYLYAKDKIPKYATNIDQREYQKRMDELWEKASNAEKQKVLDDYNKKFEPQKLKDKIQVASKAKAELVWNEKYKPKIDWNSKKSFDLKVKQLTESGKANATKYANDHINWLKSNALLQALHAYDQNEVKEYGFLFHTHVMAMLHGMSGFDAGQALLEEWLSAAKVDDKNLYYRAVCYNQKGLIEKFNNCAPSLMTLTWDQSQGTLKNTIATFVAFDQLWDEWLTTGKYKVDELKWYNPAKSVYWISEITRTVTKWSLQYNLNSKMAAGLAKISFIAYAHGSLLTNKVPKWSLLYNVDLRNANAANRLNATEIQKTWKKVEENTAAKKIKEILNQSPESGKIRISSIVALFELINLATQSNKFMAEKNWENGFQVTAGLFASTAVVLDIAGGGMEALSFADKANKIRLCGGVFAVTGAAFGAFADGTSAYKEFKGDKDIYLLALTSFKTGVSALTFCVGLGLLLKLPVLENSFLTKFANKYVMSRILLAIMTIRAAAYLNLVGLGLAVIEIVLKTWFIPNDVQKWCMKTVFGMGEKKYKNIKEEDDEFAKALESI